MALYTVQWGDTLEWIAWDYEVAGGWPALARLNGLRDPDLILMGQHLKIPRSGGATAGLPPWPGMEPVEDPPRACQVERLEPPRPAQLPGCAAAACVPLDGGWQRICSCQATQGSPGFVLVEGGRPVQAWPAPVLGSPGNDPASVKGTARDFDVVKADLDGDGRREHVVAFRRELNDLGMSWWNLAVLSGAQPQAAPLLFTAANYGEGSLLRSDSASRCDLLTTTWELAWEPAGPTNPGWTLLGRPMRYGGGALEPLRERPIYARRRYHSFDPGSVPLPGGLAIGTPARDLSHAKAHTRVVEPAAERTRIDDSAITITTARPRVDPELGVVADLDVSRDGYAWALGWRAWDQGYEALGHRGSGRLFPPGYRPAEPGWPVGRPATLGAYDRGFSDALQLVWVD
jgi:LysM repeat protein